jgi:hypothetical protein
MMKLTVILMVGALLMAAAPAWTPQGVVVGGDYRKEAEAVGQVGWGAGENGRIARLAY